MQVNRINQTAPNFGRLMIEADRISLQTVPEVILDKIDSAGQIVNDTKNYNVLITKDLKAKLVSDNNPYFGLFTNDKYITHYGYEKINGKKQELKNVVVINDGVRDRYNIEKILPEGESVPRYKVWGPYGKYDNLNDIIPLSMATKMLDDISIIKANEIFKTEAAVKSTKARTAAKAKHLIDLYGV
jgi:hypothetical protein